MRASHLSPKHISTLYLKNPQRLNVVITGSTKGFGKALASEYYANGANVIIHSRHAYNVANVYNELYSNKEDNLLYGIAADVSNAQDVKFMLDSIQEKMPVIDLWINNAGICTYEKQPFLELEDTNVNTIVSTNMLGVMYCCAYVMPVMESQSNGGHIINVIGAGSNGKSTDGYSVYGSTNSGIMQFTKTLTKETTDSKVGIHILSLEMVQMDLIMSNVENDPKLREVIDIMCENPPVVSHDIVKKINKEVLIPNTHHTIIKVFDSCKLIRKIIAYYLRKIFGIY